LFKKLYSQSGKFLKVVDLTKSCWELHINYHKATPKLFALNQTSLYYYDQVNNLHNDTKEALAVQTNTVNKYLTFVCSNNCRQGFNSLSNRLRSISNKIEKSWPSLARETFKMKCKINIIQSGLLLLWITCSVCGIFIIEGVRSCSYGLEYLIVVKSLLFCYMRKMILHTSNILCPLSTFK